MLLSLSIGWNLLVAIQVRARQVLYLEIADSLDLFEEDRILATTNRVQCSNP